MTSAAADSLVIDTRSLTKAYGPFKALDNISLSVRAGTIYGLVGPNGSGKTTLVKTLCGLLKPTSGEATILGHDLRRDAEWIRQNVGYMSQAFSLYPDLTCRENLEFFARVHGYSGSALRRRMDEVLERTGLGAHLDKQAVMLSGGWKQRLALATTIFHYPPLMFLDEPTAGIDPVARRELWDLLFDVAAAGSDIVVTTQYMDEVERCSEVGYLYLSRLIISGTPRELKRRTLETVGDARFVEFDCDQAPVVAQWLRKQPFCSGASVFGAAVHALVTSSYSDVDVRANLAAAGFAASSVRTIEPTLEDVFVVLTKQSADERNKH